MTGGLGVAILISIAAAGAGMDGIAHLRASRLDHFYLVVMAAGSVALQPVIPAADAAVFHHALAGTGRIGDQSTLIPGMPQRFRGIRHKGRATALAAVDGLAACFTSGGNDRCFIVVRECCCHIRDMAVPAGNALLDGVTRHSAGRCYSMDRIVMFPLRGIRLLHLAAAGTDFQQLAIALAGGVPQNDALPGVAQGIHIVPLLDFSTSGTKIAVISYVVQLGLTDSSRMNL